MLSSKDYNEDKPSLQGGYYSRLVHLHGECFCRGRSGLCGRTIDS